MIKDRAETEADLGTLLPRDALCLSEASFWLPRRRPAPGSRPRGLEFLVPVLLLRRRMRFRLTRSAGEREKEPAGQCFWGAESSPGQRPTRGKLLAGAASSLRATALNATSLLSTTLFPQALAELKAAA